MIFSIQGLVQEALITDEKLESLMMMVKFRNRVVHIYNDLDPKEIYRIINHNLADFAFFLEEIRLYLEGDFKGV